jgi:hypothetical protein
MSERKNISIAITETFDLLRKHKELSQYALKQRIDCHQNTLSEAIRILKYLEIIGSHSNTLNNRGGTLISLKNKDV